MGRPMSRPWGMRISTRLGLMHHPSHPSQRQRVGEGRGGRGLLALTCRRVGAPGRPGQVWVREADSVLPSVCLVVNLSSSFMDTLVCCSGQKLGRWMVWLYWGMECDLGRRGEFHHCTASLVHQRQLLEAI